MVINIDSDGVVYDWHGFMIPFLTDRLGVEMTRDSFIEWDLAQSLDVSKKDFYQVFDEAVFANAFKLAGEVPGAIHAVRSLVNDGHRVRIVTNKILKGSSKTYRAQVDTLAWYHENIGLDQLEMVFTGSKHGKSAYPADIVIDDKPDMEWTQPGAMNLLFDQPWNRAVPDDPGGHIRAVGWAGALTAIRIQENSPRRAA
jgi:hypothetical protein